MRLTRSTSFIVSRSSNTPRPKGSKAMAYGDSKIDPSKLATTEGKVLGKDANGKDIVRDKKFLIDSGASSSCIDRDNLKDMQLTYKGASTTVTAGGMITEDIFTGATFQFQGKNAKGEKVDFKCSEPFAISQLPILGADQFKKTKV